MAYKDMTTYLVGPHGMKFALALTQEGNVVVLVRRMPAGVADTKVAEFINNAQTGDSTMTLVTYKPENAADLGIMLKE